MLGTSVIVAFTNAGINKVVKKMGSFEKHKCMDDEEARPVCCESLSFFP